MISGGRGGLKTVTSRAEVRCLSGANARVAGRITSGSQTHQEPRGQIRRHRRQDSICAHNAIIIIFCFTKTQMRISMFDKNRRLLTPS